MGGFVDAGQVHDGVAYCLLHGNRHPVQWMGDVKLLSLLCSEHTTTNKEHEHDRKAPVCACSFSPTIPVPLGKMVSITHPAHSCVRLECFYG